MCTVSINIDDTVMRRINPALTTSESIGLWLQQRVNEWLEEMMGQANSSSPNVHSADEMKAIVAERLHQMETGHATYIDGEEGFAQIRKRYGL